MTKARRILGSAGLELPGESLGDAKSPSITASQFSPSPAKKDSPLPEESESSLICPICNENMLTVAQLNRHIDDTHLADSDHTVTPVTSPYKDSKLTPRKSLVPSPLDFIKKTTPTRKTISLDLFEGSKTFSISDSNASKRTPKSPTPLQKPRVSRSHWIQPSGTSVCGFSSCGKPLNVRNGIVNCRKCGLLFCNEHTDFKARLRNPVGDEKTPQYDKDGIVSKCCESCYVNKPDLAKGTTMHSIDLTEEYRKVRSVQLEQHEIVADKIIKKFIKLVNLLTEVFLTSTKQQETASFLDFFKPAVDEKLLEEKEKEIIGYDNWEDDALIHFCYICMSTFSFLIRKHHCRLCGRIVCDDKYSERKNCSLLVPLSAVLSKLPGLNYSLQVKHNFQQVLESTSDIFLVRMCKNCKDDLLYDYRLKLINDKRELVATEIFNHYNQLIVTKQKIIQYLEKYQHQLDAQTNTDFFKQHMETTNKLRDRTMLLFKDFEREFNDFKTAFYHQNEIVQPYEKHDKILKGINLSMILFLQQDLMRFKALNNRLKDKENALIPRKPELQPPRLTKKEIRQLREQLMVMNEQKFIVENLINDVTKQRKFDELQPLLNNKSEIVAEIGRLETQLGEFAF